MRLSPTSNQAHTATSAAAVFRPMLAMAPPSTAASAASTTMRTSTVANERT